MGKANLQTNEANAPTMGKYTKELHKQVGFATATCDQRPACITEYTVTTELENEEALLTQHLQEPALPPPGYARHDTPDY